WRATIEWAFHRCRIISRWPFNRIVVRQVNSAPVGILETSLAGFGREIAKFEFPICVEVKRLPRRIGRVRDGGARQYERHRDRRFNAHGTEKLLKRRWASIPHNIDRQN